MLNATERKALTLSTFVAACIAFMPAEIMSGLGLLVVSAVLFEYDRVMSRREEAAASTAAPPEPPPPPAAPEPGHLGT
jgi:hypothetical protein